MKQRFIQNHGACDDGQSSPTWLASVKRGSISIGSACLACHHRLDAPHASFREVVGTLIPGAWHRNDLFPVRFSGVGPLAASRAVIAWFGFGHDQVVGRRAWVGGDAQVAGTAKRPGPARQTLSPARASPSQLEPPSRYHSRSAASHPRIGEAPR